MAEDSPNTEAQRARRSALDRPLARWIAVGVALAAAGALAAIHREDLFPPEQAAAPAADDPFQACLRQRQADIEQMQADGVIDADQAKLFIGRAEALCQTQTQGNAPPPPAN